tara:strand:- start:368 stop:607 length:240 start_codon:yes stop_codon:yes gene_type:complete
LIPLVVDIIVYKDKNKPVWVERVRKRLESHYTYLKLKYFTYDIFIRNTEVKREWVNAAKDGKNGSTPLALFPPCNSKRN